MIEQERLRNRLRKVMPELDKRADAMVKLAEYHRHAMESRRDLELKALLAILAFDAYVFAESQKFIASLSKVIPRFGFSSQLSPNYVLIGFVVVVFLTYLATMILVEIRNLDDRHRYSQAERNAWELLDRRAWSIFYAATSCEDWPVFRRSDFFSWRVWALWGPVTLAFVSGVLTILGLWAA
jgi:hypothetical protein